MTIFRRTFARMLVTGGIALGLSMGLAATTAPMAQAEMIRAKGPVLLTITGEMNNPNRGGYDPARDKFFGFNEVEFSQAREFDFEALEALKTVKIMADFPKGETVHSFEGPLLVDVLKAAGAVGDMVTVQALDGYAVEVPLADLEAKGAVVALKRDGAAFGIGDFGPTQIVFPRADRADLKDMSDDNWVWSIFHISVK